MVAASDDQNGLIVIHSTSQALPSRAAHPKYGTSEGPTCVQAASSGAMTQKSEEILVINGDIGQHDSGVDDQEERDARSDVGSTLCLPRK